MAEFVELYIDQGTDFSTTITLNDEDTNLPQNLAGYVVTSQLRRSLLSVNAAGAFTCSVSNTSNGTIVMSMTSSNTANLRAGSYFFDVRVYESLGLSYSRLVEGIIHVTPAITR